MNERERQAVLFANEAFYTAFASGNLTQMDALWAPDPWVSCIHPGWAPLIGRDAILQSWEAIMKSPPPVIVQGAEVVPMAAGPEPDKAYVLCYEVIGADTLIATNIFCKLADGWKIQHHQAGPCPPVQMHEDAGKGRRVN